MADLSDRGLSIFAFALYHQLIGGEAVTGVVLDDGAGHAADPDGVEEVTLAGLGKVDNGRLVFTPQGARRLETLAAAFRGG